MVKITTRITKSYDKRVFGTIPIGKWTIKFWINKRNKLLRRLGIDIE